MKGLFLEEICNAFFAPKVERKIINPASWDINAQGPHERLLYYAVAHRRVNPSLFTFLFTAVCKRQFAKAGMMWTNRERPRQLVLQWCRLAMHRYWRLEWVVEKEALNVATQIAHYPVDCEFMQGFYDSDRELTAGERLAKRHDNDCMFLELGSANVNDDRDAILAGFFGFCSGVDELNYCFGTTLLALAVQW